MSKAKNVTVQGSGISRRTFGKLAGGAAVIGGATLGSPFIISVRGEETVKLGGLFHMTGPGSIWGPSMQQCMELAVNEINAGGGVLGRQLELVSEDDATSTDVGVQKATKLIQADGCLALIGVVYSSVRAAIAENAAARFKVPYFYPTYFGKSKTSCGHADLDGCAAKSAARLLHPLPDRDLRQAHLLRWPGLHLAAHSRSSTSRASRPRTAARWLAKSTCPSTKATGRRSSTG